MTISFRWLAFLPLLLLSAAAQNTLTKDQATLVITHVTVIDATGAPAQPDMTVVIAGGRVAEVGKSSAVRSPRGARHIDATGKFLIPGLWDMHVHWGDTEYLPLFIANGVTGMRIMWGFPIHQDWRRESEAGRLLAPHLYIASPIVEGPKPRWPPDSVSVASDEQARQAVIDAKKYGADFIKIYDTLPRTEYFAIVDEAKKQNMTFVGHVPISVTASEASSAGQKSFEHLTGILSACSTRERDVNQAAQADLDDILARKEGAEWIPHSRALQQLEVDTYSPEKADALFAVLKRNGTWQCPTLTVLHAVVNLDDTAFTNDPRLKYMPHWARAFWEPANARETYKHHGFTKAEFEKVLQIVGAMQKAGVGLLAGTDASNAYCMPGFSLHDELGLMVQAGLTPMQALQTATLNPARFIGREKDLGTVEKGKLADLVLLDANPLDDIANTRKIASVIYGGTLYSRTQLDKMLSNVEAEAARSPISDPLMKTIKERDVAAAIRQYHDLKSTQPTKYDFSSRELIDLGYSLLGAKKVSEAIEIFKLSVEVDPTNFNTWDSLADAYLAHDDKALAVKNYRRALELNPSDRNAVEKLQQLGTSQSPFNGTWRLDNDQTQSTIHYDYVLQDGTFRCTTCDPPVTVKADGQDRSVAGNLCYDAVSVRVVDDRTTEETDKKNGKIVGTQRMTVSADGNTATDDWTESCNAKGDVVDGKDIMTRLAPGPAGSHAISGSWKISKRVSRSENALVITLQLTPETFSFSDPAGMGYVAKLDGSETPFRGSLDETVVSLKRLDESRVEETDKRDGKVVQVTRFVISPDGKTLTITEEDKSKGTTRRFVAHKQ